MKSIKYQILFVLLVMMIGLAAITSNLAIGGTANVAKNPDDFLVYFSDVEVNGVQDLSLVRNENELVFDKEFNAVGQRVEISYDITNASKNYDASISINCTESTEYLTITNEFDTSSNLSATSTKTGVLTITQSKSYTGSDLAQEITCTINASAVERTTQGSGTVVEPAENPYPVGKEIAIGDEKFNVISSDATTVTMLAQKNISDSTPYKQTDTQIWTIFSDNNGWEYTPGPKEIDVQTWGGNAKTILNNYVSYLKTQYNVDVTGNFITVSELGDLGCTVPTDYAWGDAEYGDYTCNNSEHSEWLVNGQYWWTRSASSEDSSTMWIMYDDGDLDYNYCNDTDGVRPVIKISKSLL